MDKRYQVISILGRGTFSTVFLGKHKTKNEKVAIKTESKKSPTEGNSLKHECKILLYLAKTPGVPNVRYFEYGEPNSQNVFMVIDYYEKKIDAVLKTLNVLEKFHIFKQGFIILKSIHSKFIIHRDIKPANFMLHNNEVFLIDFGMAKVIDTQEKQISEIIGTPKFVSLFVHDFIQPSRRDDFISLGYTFLYMILNGDLPWDNNNLEDIKKKKIEFLENTELFINKYIPKKILEQELVISYIYYIADYLIKNYSSNINDVYFYQLPDHPIK